MRLHALATLGSWANANNSILELILDRSRNDPRADVRSLAIQLLGQSAYPKPMVEPTLNGIIANDSSYNVVGNALQVLHLYDPDLAYQDALGYLKTNSPRDHIRHEAVIVLEHTKTPASLQQLIALVDTRNIPNDSHQSTRNDIVDAISKFVSVDSGLVYRTLWNLTMNGDNGVHGSAINRLADIGNAATMHQLEAQEATRPEMKSTYEAALTKMRKRLGM